MTLLIKRISPAASVQGLPQTGLRKFGVPPGGAMDIESFLLANALLGNSRDARVLEIPLTGAAFSATGPIQVSLVGAECAVSVNGRALSMQSSVGLSEGDELSLGPATRGVRVYLGLPGGLHAPGGLEVGGVLQALEVARSKPKGRLAAPPSSLEPTIRFLRGPQAESFDVEAFSRTQFTVSPVCDRRGIRLLGECLGLVEELPSEPSCVGAIQVTPSMEAIIIGPDGPTIGGYPKIGVVISADLDKLGQLAPGSKFTFSEVTTAEGEAAWKNREGELHKKLAFLKLP